MLGTEIIPYLKFVHGGYNFIVCLLFIYQALLGVRIRRNRKAGGQYSRGIKRHRKAGPFLACLGVFGFFAGKTLVYLDHGHFLEHSLHYITGSLIAVLILATVFISRKIRSTETRMRDIHFRLGICIVCLYFLQLYLGIGILYDIKLCL